MNLGAASPSNTGAAGPAKLRSLGVRIVVPPGKRRRTKSEYGILQPVGMRKNCTVSFSDSEGVRHSVDVSAETMYEAAVLALRSFREHDCNPGPAAHLSVEVKSPGITHTLVAHAVEDWLNGGARSPREAIEKKRLREILDAPATSK
jgi:hypothetical protein